jgi:hypothetical protein
MVQVGLRAGYARNANDLGHPKQINVQYATKKMKNNYGLQTKKTNY